MDRDSKKRRREQARGGGGIENEGMHDRKQTKTLYSREREADTDSRKGDRQGESEESMKRRKTRGCCVAEESFTPILECS